MNRWTSDYATYVSSPRSAIVTLTYLKDQDESSAGEAEHKHNIQQHEVQRAGPRSATSGTD
jgi:predicted transcriptional regulator